MSRVVELRGVGHRYVDGGVAALVDVDLDIEPGHLMAVHGRSGSGKTTLLNVIGGLLRPTDGTVNVCGVDLTQCSDAERIAVRRTSVGFVFQSFGLVPVLTAAENIEVPLRLIGMERSARRERVSELLDLVGLGARGRHRPGELSGGEQQRVAVARALSSSPRLLIADEPTGQLDSKTGRSIMALIESLVADAGLAAIVATHDPAVVSAADVRASIGDGRVT